MNNMKIYWSEISVLNCKAQKIVIKPRVMHCFVIYKIQCNRNFENNTIKFYILAYKISCDRRIFETNFNITFKHKSYY